MFSLVIYFILIQRTSQVSLVVKNPPANAENVRALGLIPGLGRSPEGGHGNPLQYSCLENPMDRGACWCIVHGIKKSWTGLKQLSTHAVIVYTCQSPSPNSSHPLFPTWHPFASSLCLCLCFHFRAKRFFFFWGGRFPLYLFIFLEANYYTILYWFCHTLT